MVDHKLAAFLFWASALICAQVIVKWSLKYSVAYVMLGNQILYYVFQECMKKTRSMRLYLNCFWLF